MRRLARLLAVFTIVLLSLQCEPATAYSGPQSYQGPHHTEEERGEFYRLLDKWGPIHKCETGATYNWALNSGNGYYGGLQVQPQDVA